MAFSFDDTLLTLAMVLVAGVVGGELVARARLPKVTGWIGTGILLRSLELPGLEPDTVTGFGPYMNFVLGYIAFTVGAALHFRRLLNSGRRLMLLLMAEGTITPIIIFAALFFLGGYVGEAPSLQVALILAAVGVAGAPGTTVLVVQEARARGILTRTLLAAVALIDMIAVAAFVFVFSILQHGGVDLATAAAAIGFEFGVAFVVGAGCSLLAIVLRRTVVGPAFLGPIIVCVILGSWGAAVGFGASGILACTFAGMTISNVRHRMVSSAEAYLHSIGGVLFAAFYTFAGMKLDFSQVPAALGLVLLYFLARLGGKVTSSYVAMRVAHVPHRVRKYLGLALLPHGGVAVGLILLVQQTPELAGISETVTTLGLAALAINQLLGPSATRLSLHRSGEAGRDRARLLDFIDEQHIVVGLQGAHEREVIHKLTSRLYQLHPDIPLPQEEFVSRVLRMEQDEEFHLGEGLMIPHAILEGGSEITGVLGLSSKGLQLGAPDDRPVHAVLLLATPEVDRRRHLLVLAAFSQELIGDPLMRAELYHARSAAQAYDVLHHEDAEEVNYYLEDALARAQVGVVREGNEGGRVSDAHDDPDKKDRPSSWSGLPSPSES